MCLYIYIFSPLRLSFVFKSCGLWTLIVTLPITINKTLKWLSSLPILTLNYSVIPNNPSGFCGSKSESVRVHCLRLMFVFKTWLTACGQSCDYFVPRETSFRSVHTRGLRYRITRLAAVLKYVQFPVSLCLSLSLSVSVSLSLSFSVSLSLSLFLSG